MHHNQHKNRALARAAHVAAAFANWLRAEGEQLVDAADLLGGQHWRRRAEAAVEAVRHGTPAHEMGEEFAALHGLLTLEPTDDPFSDEALRFAAVDPDDPRATEAMLCAEALEHVLHALAVLGRPGCSDLLVERSEAA